MSLANNPSFLRVGHKKNISAGEYCEYLLKNRAFSSFFVDGTFGNRRRQFAQLCGMNLDLEAHRMKTTYVRFCLYFCLTKKNIFLTLLKIWCSFWSPEIIKIDYEAIVISAIKKSLSRHRCSSVRVETNTKYW